jgi:uncharacterized delta-60 repeat protein
MIRKISLFIMVLSYASFAEGLTDLDIEACSVTCSVSGLNIYNLSNDLILTPGSSGSVTLSDPSLPNGTNITKIAFNFSHSGETGIDGVWTIDFTDDSGTITYCSDNSIAHTDSEFYPTENLDITSPCSSLKSVDNLTSLKIKFTNGDSKSPDDAYLDWISIEITYQVGFLNVTLNVPSVDSSSKVSQNKTFSVNATMKCSGSGGAVCDVPTGTLRLNESSIPDTNTSKKIAGLPFYVASSTFENNNAFIWNLTYPSDTISGTAYSVKSDIYNNIIVAGYEFSDWQIRKYSENGTLLWNRSYNPGIDDRAQSVDIDKENNIIVAGFENSNDWRVMKFDENGTSLWNRTDNPGANDNAKSVAVDSNNSIIVAGYQTDANRNWRIMKLNSTGGSIWNLTFNLGANDEARGVSVDSNDNIIVAGKEELIANNESWRVMKFDSNGTSIWNFTFDGLGDHDTANSIAVDSNDNILVAGNQFYGGGNRDSNWTVFKLDSSGNHLWNITYNSFTGESDDQANSITTDSNNNVIAGGVDGTAGVSWRIIKFNENGTSLWNTTFFFGDGIESIQGITTDNNDNIVAAGYVINPSFFIDNWHIRKYEINRNPQNCPSGLLSGQSCSMTWVVNATGAIGSSYYMDVNFTSSDSAILSNDTGNFQINVTGWEISLKTNISLFTEGSSSEIVQNTTFTVNSSITCETSDGGECGEVFAQVLFNSTPGQYTFVNSSIDDTPFHVLNSNLSNFDEFNITQLETIASVLEVAAGDLDNDGLNEIVIGTSSQVTNELRYYKNQSDEWNEFNITGTGADNINTLAIGDLDNDGLNEIVVGLASTTNELRYYKNQSNGWDEFNITDVGSAAINSLAVADADNDGLNEIVVGLSSTTNELRYYKNQSTLWDEFNITNNPSVNINSVSIGDVDNDGLNEITAGLASTTNELRYYKNQSNGWDEFNITDVGSAALSSVVAEDADNDGKNEIVIGTSSLASNELRYYKNQSNGWDEFNLSNVVTISSVAVNDVDNESNKEIIIGTDEASTQNYIMYYKINKNHLSCGILSDGQTCNVSWTINATGPVGSEWNFTVNFTVNPSNDTGGFGVTITGGAGPVSSPRLSVVLDRPEPSTTTNVFQNATFNITANVTCLGGSCGTVDGVPRYNVSGTVPDTDINGTAGEAPFYNSTVNQTCGTMNQDDLCQLSWLVNATGNPGLDYNIDVNFTSDTLESNATTSAKISIISCTVDFTLHWTSISFGTLNPNTQNNIAPGNSNQTYNTTVNQGSCNLDLYLKGSDFTNGTTSAVIEVGNISWNNQSNDPGTSVNLTYINTLIQGDVTPDTNITTWYWMSVPPAFAARYNGTISITGVVTGETP